MSTNSVEPDTVTLLNVLVRLHDDVRQTQYPYSQKIGKFGAIQEAEIRAALKTNPQASEKTVWSGETASSVALRLAGALQRAVDEDGAYRERWEHAGMPEGSWKFFLGLNCLLAADGTPFQDAAYLRNEEATNLVSLCRILDEEVFGHAQISSSASNLRASFKSKWWKECHRVFAGAAALAIYHRMKLPEPPAHICHTAEWSDDVKAEVRKMATRWRTCALWDQKNGKNQSAHEVDFTSNNEATIRLELGKFFTVSYLQNG
jgi:hypothetical protein